MAFRIDAIQILCGVSLVSSLLGISIPEMELSEFVSIEIDSGCMYGASGRVVRYLEVFLFADLQMKFRNRSCEHDNFTSVALTCEL